MRRGFVRHLEIQKKGIRVMGPYSGDVFLLDGFIVYEVQLINVNSKMRKIEIIFKAKKAHLPLGENIIFSKDIDSLDLQYFMRLCRI